MKFIQSKKDGSAEIVFSDEEIEILKKYKKLTFTPEGFKDFSTNLVGICSEFYLNFQKNVQDKQTYGQEVKPKNPADL